MGFFFDFYQKYRKKNAHIQSLSYIRPFFFSLKKHTHTHTVWWICKWYFRNARVFYKSFVVLIFHGWWYIYFIFISHLLAGAWISSSSSSSYTVFQVLLCCAPLWRDQPSKRDLQEYEEKKNIKLNIQKIYENLWPHRHHLFSLTRQKNKIKPKWIGFFNNEKKKNEKPIDKVNESTPAWICTKNVFNCPPVQSVRVSDSAYSSNYNSIQVIIFRRVIIISGEMAILPWLWWLNKMNERTNGEKKNCANLIRWA